MANRPPCSACSCASRPLPFRPLSATGVGAGDGAGVGSDVGAGVGEAEGKGVGEPMVAPPSGRRDERPDPANFTGLVLGGGGGRPDYLQKLKVPEGYEKMIDYSNI